MINDIVNINKIYNFIDDFQISKEEFLNEINDIFEKKKIIERYKKFIFEIEEFNIEKELNQKKLDEKEYHELTERYKILKKYTPQHPEDTFIIKIISDDIDIIYDIFSSEINITDDRYIKLPFKETKKLLLNYHILNNKLDFRYLSGQQNVDWSFENIDIGIELNILNWDAFSMNSGINWNYELLRKYKEFLNWDYVKLNYNYVWDELLIDEFSEYIFNSNNKDLYIEEEYYGDLFDINNLKFELNLNIKWNLSLLIKYQKKLDWNLISENNTIIFDDLIVNYFSEILNFESISKSKNLNISQDVVIKYADRWDFRYLIRNRNLKWNFNTLFILKDKLDWKYIITFDYLKWDKIKIDIFSNYIFNIKSSVNTYLYDEFIKENYHSGFFESNSNCIWTYDIFKSYHSVVNWEYIFRNESIVFDKIFFKELNHIIPKKLFFRYAKIQNLEEILEEHFDNEFSSALCLNKYIKWDLNLFETYISKILHQEIYLLKQFCSHSIISEDIIIKYHYLWNKEIELTKYYRRNSDGSYHDKYYEKMWYYLKINPNLHWNENIIEKCLYSNVLIGINSSKLTLTTKFIDKYWDYTQEIEYWRFGNYDTGTYQEKAIIKMKHLFAGCIIKDLNLDKLIQYEKKWINSPLTNYQNKMLNPSIKYLILNGFH